MNTMTLKLSKKEIIKELADLGTAQNRKIYARHGVVDDQFGVSFANLGKLQKKIRVDHDLALGLWETGNHDARVLATMIADPGEIKASLLNTWVKALNNHILTDGLSTLAGKSPVGKGCLEKWIKSKAEWVCSCGWMLLADFAMAKDEVTDSYFEAYLETIEENLQHSKNGVKHSMNNALIAIGIRNSRLKKRAVAVARRIGKVEVDHGETSCQTPDAIAYIEKTLEHRRKKGG